MSEAPVIARKEGKAGRLTLNNPKQLHALTFEMCAIMCDALNAWRHDDEVELIILDHKEGTRGFCAGGDINMLSKSGAGDGVEGRAFFEIEYRLNTLIHNYEKPYVAIMDGVAMGGGVGISVHGSHRVATKNSVFAMPEAGIGLFPDVGGGWFLPRLQGHVGMWLALTGARLKGEDVLSAGIATHFVDLEAMEDLKVGLTAVGTAMLDDVATYAEPSYGDYTSEIWDCFSKDSVEDIIAALEAGGTDWCAKQLQAMRQKCPMTLKVTHRQLREGAAMKTMEDNMRMEYRIGGRMIHRADFAEGVRAVIIEKDNAPKWSPAAIEDVTDAMVDELFAPVEQELTF